MPQRILLLVSHNSCRLFAFDYDLIARVLAHVEVRSGNTHGEDQHMCGIAGLLSTGSDDADGIRRPCKR